MPLLQDFTELFHHPVCFQALPTQLRLSGSLSPAAPTSHLPSSPLPAPTLEKAAAILHSVTQETSRCCGDNGLLASLPLPAASQKLGAASEDAVLAQAPSAQTQAFSMAAGKATIVSI